MMTLYVTIIYYYICINNRKGKINGMGRSRPNIISNFLGEVSFEELIVKIFVQELNIQEENEDNTENSYFTEYSYGQE